MDSSNNFLITMTDGVQLFRIALNVAEDILTSDAKECPLEPENKEQFFKLLPLHCQSLGKIVQVQEIFEIVV